MEQTNLWGLLAVFLATAGTVLATYLGRTRTTKQELSAAPAQPAGAWSMSPEMYSWFEERIAKERTRADRNERLLGHANDYIDRQADAGAQPVLMHPELLAARNAR